VKRRNSINKLFTQICVRIAEICEENSVFEIGEIEFDESYFGGKRKGKRGRGAKGKTSVARKDAMHCVSTNGTVVFI